ncbi:hypothetical protein BDP81DRAFT_441611 [Colletotrichum phormii]|uniref:Uncharacterized protein n=1 Tax=Colletotrichum phormii TaxID=359342 RepID=A0AAI9ZD83_9PEZI|nr:uncharacterized protein BDP81DRAFT_441611 [Colletotrichum phormii]KAK1622392.1 hypothetical protein BDP81DRAFT_441611 [Colletotrichum phormii]
MQRSSQGRIGGDQGQVADTRGVVKAVSVLLVSKLSIFFGCARVAPLFLSFVCIFSQGLGSQALGSISMCVITVDCRIESRLWRSSWICPEACTFFLEERQDVQECETRGASARLGQKVTLEGGQEPERQNVSCAPGCVGCVGNTLKNWWEMRRCVRCEEGAVPKPRHWRGILRYGSPRYSRLYS